jgi:hypothetical protein
MKKILAGAVIFFIGMACGLMFIYGPTHANAANNSDEVLMAKMDEVVNAINDMKEDIRIIKIRVTQGQ